MTRLSEYLLPTEKQPPADAEAISHKLMVRAGLIRQMGAGMWTWLPAGWRVHQRVVAIIREEMDAIGGQEMLMPVLQPAEPWRKSGRLEIEELFKLTDRKGSELVLAMTHEEAVTFHAAQVVRSYRDLPLILYHFQIKERDEPRPRAGVLRTREFMMKDSYSFDRDQAGLEERYELHVGAYDRMMERTGLRFYRVESDVGMMGGLGAHEYMAPCAGGRGSGGARAGLRRQRRGRAAQPGRAQDGRRLRPWRSGAVDRAGDRGGQHLQARYPLLRAARSELPRRERSASCRCGWAPTGSARRGSWPPRSSSSPTSTASPGRERWRRSRCTWWASASRARPSSRLAEQVYETLREGGVDVLYDDRELGPGEKFADAELLGCPLRLTVGRRALESGEIEVQVRRGRQSAPGPAARGRGRRARARGGRAVAEPPVDRSERTAAEHLTERAAGSGGVAERCGSPA